MTYYHKVLCEVAKVSYIAVDGYCSVVCHTLHHCNYLLIAISECCKVTLVVIIFLTENELSNKLNTKGDKSDDNDNETLMDIES